MSDVMTPKQRSQTMSHTISKKLQKIARNPRYSDNQVQDCHLL